MKLYDLDSLGEKQGIDNKYVLTVAVAARARALSEQKGRTLEEENEKFISTALEEFYQGRPNCPAEEEKLEAEEDARVEEE
ncbi:MAG: DNA-directed RNA polymerase subunit omega [Synergistaceae bacterium]|nr:DNA-directed RNA polymerase subunit omega [Synergistota bacterium]NLM70925.1 DNA-directed RNA polymerase subunit omega [Synergistaceae bacterium]